MDSNDDKILRMNGIRCEDGTILVPNTENITLLPKRVVIFKRGDVVEGEAGEPCEKQ